MKTKTKNELKAFAAPYVEATEQLEQLLLPRVWVIKKIMGTLYSSQKQIGFQEYLEGLAYFFSNNSISADTAKDLIKKVSDSSNYGIMTNILDSVFFSRSKISRAILGVIAGKFLHNDKLDYEDMVLVSALKDIFDEELNHFIHFFNCKPCNVNDNTSIIEHYSETDRLIMEKFQNVGILGRDLAGNRLSDSSLRFELTLVSNRLKEYLEYIHPININIELKN